MQCITVEGGGAAGDDILGKRILKIGWPQSAFGESNGMKRFVYQLLARAIQRRNTIRIFQVLPCTLDFLRQPYIILI